MNSLDKYKVTLNDPTVMGIIYQLKYANQIMGREPRFVILGELVYQQLRHEFDERRHFYGTPDDVSYEVKEFAGLAIVRTGEMDRSVKIGE